MKVRDPVCGIELEKWEAEAQYSLDKNTYYFCSKDCRDSFVKNPKKFIGSSTPAYRNF